MDTTPEQPVAPGVDLTQILAMLPHRWPFVLVDRVVSVEPGVRGHGRKCVSASEPWVPGHFPGRPVLPGVLMAEAFAQMACIVAMSASPDDHGREVLLLGMDRFRFRRAVVPGDVVDLHVEVLAVRKGVWKFGCRATVDGERAAEGELLATVARS